MEILEEGFKSTLLGKLTVYNKEGKQITITDYFPQ